MSVEMSKLKKAIKKHKNMMVVNTADSSGELFQMVGYNGNLYRVDNMPILNDVQMLTFLGMEKADKGSLNYKESNVLGNMFQDDCPGEEQLFFNILMSDPELVAFWPSGISGGEVVFSMAESFLLAGMTGNTRAFLRKDNNLTCIAIKEGMFLKALLVPQDVTVETLLDTLDNERMILECALKQEKE